jgi:triacylglycerol lipase
MRRIIGILLSCLTLTAGSFAVATSAYAATEPVVFVHGFGGSGSNFDSLEAHLRANGWTSGQLFEFNYNTSQSNRTSASQLRTFVNNVRSQTGASEVDLVNHSMGGLVTRWYVQMLGGNETLDDVVSLAGANHGTTSANACLFLISCLEMRPGSIFLDDLAEDGDETPDPARYATFYSPCDGVINPYTSTLLSGAQNTNVGCVSHLAILSHSPTHNGVRTFIQ